MTPTNEAVMSVLDINGARALADWDKSSIGALRSSILKLVTSHEALRKERDGLCAGQDELAQSVHSLRSECERYRALIEMELRAHKAYAADARNESFRDWHLAMACTLEAALNPPPKEGGKE